MKTGSLILESGEVFSGVLETEDVAPRAAEVVFNTSHSGYQEIATDPSYFNQMVVMTAPMMGNYGVHAEHPESRQIWISGFLCVSLQKSERDCAWRSTLNAVGVPILSGVDTRALVLRLREGGTPWGAVIPEDVANPHAEAKQLIAETKEQDRDWVYCTTRESFEEIEGHLRDGPRVAVLDLGCKENILREVSARSSKVGVFPSRTSAEEIFAWHPDGVVFSNGPGDPGDVQVAVDTARVMTGRVPLMGICMGHQIIALALGGKTYRLHFGHRGSNHPIRDERGGKVFMTSQNHGYAVEASSLPKEVFVTHINLNDQTVAGFLWKEKRVVAYQFHPENRPGPREASELFDGFFAWIQ